MSMNQAADLDLNRVVQHPNPDISVVVPTIPERELQVIEYLRKQEITDFEVIVVVDKSKEDCRCLARNRGIQEAQSDIVALTDDDCAPPTDWLAKAIKIFSEDHSTVLLGGPVEKQQTPRHYIGANLAFDRAAAVEINGFDQRFSGGGGDDLDFGWRMEKAHGENACKYRSDWKMNHIGPLKGDFKEQNRMLLRKKHPYKYIHLIDSPVSVIQKAAAVMTIAGFQISPTLGEWLYTQKTDLRNYM